MSRSYRKPYARNPDGSKKWKEKANRIIRHNMQISNGSEYKKFNDRWTSPLEYKHLFWDVQKLRRK